MQTPACPTTGNPPFVPGTYKVEPPTGDAPAVYAAALARAEGAAAMLEALQAAGVRVPLTVHTGTVAPLLLDYRNTAQEVVRQSIADFKADQPINEARLIAERTA